MSDPNRDHKPGEFIHGNTTRRPLPAETIKPLSAGLVLAAFSSVGWIMQTLECNEDQAREFKLNAQADFESLMSQARQARGRFA